MPHWRVTLHDGTHEIIDAEKLYLSQSGVLQFLSKMHVAPVAEDAPIEAAADAKPATKRRFVKGVGWRTAKAGSAAEKPGRAIFVSIRGFNAGEWCRYAIVPE